MKCPYVLQNVHCGKVKIFIMTMVEQFFYLTTHTVLKFQDFSATTQILREINFGLFEARKTVIFTFRSYKV